MESVVIVELSELYPDFMERMEQINYEIRAFSSMENAENWLYGNGFRIGQRYFWNYHPEDAKEWIRKNDVRWNFIQVTVKEYVLDDEKRSLFEKHKPRMSLESLEIFSDTFKYNKITESKSMSEFEYHSDSSEGQSGERKRNNNADEVEKSGIEEGRAEGEDRLARLCEQLSDAGRMEDMKRVWSDHPFREECYREFSL